MLSYSLFYHSLSLSLPPHTVSPPASAALKRNLLDWLSTNRVLQEEEEEEDLNVYNKTFSSPILSSYSLVQLSYGHTHIHTKKEK